MTSKKLKPTICELFDKVRLSPEELASLRQLEAAAADATNDQADVPDPRRRRLLAIAAGISGIAITGGLSWTFTRPANTLDRLFDDVARQHLKNHAVSFPAAHIEELRDEFASQGFIVRDSAPLRGINGELVGGHKCWLLKQAAAGFRYDLEGGGWATVMQAAYNADVFGPLPDIAHGRAPLVRVTRGLKCTVWCDQGMIFTQATPA